MYKILLVILIVLWLGGFLMGRRGRRSRRKIGRLMIWFIMLFLGFSTLEQVEDISGRPWLHLLAVLAWAGLSWLISGGLQRIFTDDARKP